MLKIHVAFTSADARLFQEARGSKFDRISDDSASNGNMDVLGIQVGTILNVSLHFLARSLWDSVGWGRFQSMK